MSHEIEMVNGEGSMFSVRQVPWHKLGKILNAPPTSEEAIKEAGLDWEVELKSIYWKTAATMTENESFHPFPNRCALVRQTDGKPLSVVSDHYKPLQNKKAFEWFDPIVQDGAATYETAGSLQGGKKIWILAKLKGDFDVIKGDTVRRYLLLANGHDGVTGIMIQPTPIRVVCANTLAQSLGAGLVNTIWHHGDITQKMERVKRLLGLAEKEFESKKEVFVRMTKYPMNSLKVGTYLKNLLPDANDESAEPIKDSIRIARERIWELSETGFGTDIPGIKGTMWATYNAAIEFGEYDMPKKVRDIGNYALFGLGQQFKRRAYDKALELVNN
jgi:phage/plasmid-like protein (TIGR03299 family)